MKVVIAGGLGHVGSVLIRHFTAAQDEVVVLSRKAASLPGVRVLPWDGKTMGTWAEEMDGADVAINLAGRSVDCRYNSANLKEMLDSRVDSTRVFGEAIGAAMHPPKVWLQASTATIYAHRFDAPNDEATGILGGNEIGVPRTWNASIAIAKAWEQALEEAPTPGIRKVAMRSAMTMSVDRGSVLDVLCSLARKGLGGKLGSGRQYLSWIHEFDFAAAVQFLIDSEELTGPVNLSSPNPLPQQEFMEVLREAVGSHFALPAPALLVEIGTWAMRTESELVMKSRRVVPGRLLGAGFQFQYPNWPEAARELIRRK